MTLAADSAMRRLSLNQATLRHTPLIDAVGACQRWEIESIGLWREPVAAVGLERAAALVRHAGLRVSSLCRGGFLTASDAGERRRRIADNRRAIDEAAALGAPCLVMVVGGLPEGSRDLDAARRQVADAVAELAPYAARTGVQLGLEPMHPMYAADRSVLTTLRQALDLAEPFPSQDVGVVVDTFHLWWDPDVWHQIARAGRARRICSFQISDFLTPLPADVLLGRAMMGDGHIDFPPFLRAVAAAGFAGDTEVEIFNADVWDAQPDAVLHVMKSRYRDLIASTPPS